MKNQEIAAGAPEREAYLQYVSRFDVLERRVRGLQEEEYKLSQERKLAHQAALIADCRRSIEALAEQARSLRAEEPQVCKALALKSSSAALTAASDVLKLMLNEGAWLVRCTHAPERYRVPGRVLASGAAVALVVAATIHAAWSSPLYTVGCLVVLAIFGRVWRDKARQRHAMLHAGVAKRGEAMRKLALQLKMRPLEIVPELVKALAKRHEEIQAEAAARDAARAAAERKRLASLRLQSELSAQQSAAWHAAAVASGSEVGSTSSYSEPFQHYEPTLPEFVVNVNGLPMIGGYAGMDVAGNAYGTDSTCQ